MSKRLFLFLVLFLLMTFQLFSAPEDNLSSHPSERSVAMGRAVLAIPESADAFYGNPAVLGEKKWHLDFPLVTLAVNQIQALASAPWQGVITGDIPSVMDTVAVLSGNSRLLFLDEGIHMTRNGWAFGLDADQTVYTSGESFATDFTLSMDYDLSFGYGHRWKVGDTCALSVGVMAHGGYRRIAKEMDIIDLLPAFTGGKIPLNLEREHITLNADVGTLLSLPYGFSASLVGRNLGGKWVKGKSSSWTGMLDAGFGWTFTHKALTIALDADLADMTGIASLSDFWLHLNLGGELKLGSWFALRGGLQGGYPAAGLRLRLFFFAIDAIYFWSEWGTFVGAKPKDTLSLSLSLTFD
jgi:hypothetical protein